MVLLQDLAVYINRTDLTSAGKKCATEGLISEKLGLSCYRKLGFTHGVSLVQHLPDTVVHRFYVYELACCT